MQAKRTKLALGLILQQKKFILMVHSAYHKQWRRVAVHATFILKEEKKEKIGQKKVLILICQTIPKVCECSKCINLGKFKKKSPKRENSEKIISTS